VRHIHLSRPSEAIPAFLTILLMPVTGSITDGIIAGLFTFVIFSFVEGWLNRRRNKDEDWEEKS
jgi:AGZA family xanthine/uracil permease-like MFS transporter